MKILRSAFVVAGVAATMLSTMTPASAQTAAAFEGQASIGCFGCGTYGPEGNSATFTVTGVVQGNPYVQEPGSAEYTVTEPEGVTCVVSGSAQGTITFGTVNDADFSWTRVGATAVITVSGVGTAEAVFVVTEPHGNPCGGSVQASFAGTIAGA